MSAFFYTTIRQLHGIIDMQPNEYHNKIMAFPKKLCLSRKTMHWITAKDLNYWSDRRVSQELLPLLVRRLILACVGLQGNLRFPAGESIQQKGWDGTLETKTGNAYIPEGISKWEVSVNQNQKNKANKDYDKRTAATRKDERDNSTFIFVTTRIWADKEDWVKEKKEENNWKDIKVYDGIDLEQWLELVPSVGRWLAEEIGKYPSNIKSLETHWREWSQATKPPLNIDLIIAGRNKHLEKIDEWLSARADLHAVRSQSKEESIAFFYAALSSMPEEVREVWKSRAIIVSDENSMRILANMKEPQQIIVLNIDLPGLAQIAVGNGHHVFVPLGPEGIYGELNNQEIEELGWLTWEPFVKAIQKMGINKEEAEKLAQNSGRSLTVLRRLLIPALTYKPPVWSIPKNARVIIPALLTGYWEDDKEGDKKIIAKISGKTYEEVTDNLSNWIDISDSPLQFVSGSWKLTSAIDTWSRIGRYLTEKDLDRLKSAIMDVLGNPKPRFELEPDKRWDTELYGKKSPYSDNLRIGLAQSLAILSTFSDKFCFSFSKNPNTYVSSIVRDLLFESDGILWCSLEDVLPIIAEAAPEIFINAVEDSLDKEKPSIMRMFAEEGFLGSSPHTGLLWALEVLAWSPRYLGKVTMILGELASLDPGGRLSNRPQNTLRNIYCIWFPQTSASFEQRVDAIKALFFSEPEVGWTLLVDIIPKMHDFATPIYSPKWRNYKSLKYGPPTNLEVFNNVRMIADLLQENIDCDEDRWIIVIDKLSTFSTEDRSSLLNILENCARDKSLSGRGLKIVNKLKEILFRNKTFTEGPGLLAVDEIFRIEEIYNLLLQDDVVEKYKWLFDDQWPQLPEGRPKEFKAYDKKIQTARSEAIKQIILEKSMPGLVDIASKVEYPHTVGIAAAKEITDNDQISLIIRASLQTDNEGLNYFGMAFISRIQATKGESWVEEMYLLINKENWESRSIALFLMGLEESMVTWKKVKSFGDQVEEEYWSKLSPHRFNLSTEEKVFAVRKLIEVKRPLVALNLLEFESEDISSEEFIKVLEDIENLTSKGLINLNHLVPHTIEMILQELYKRVDIDRNRLGRLEWFFLPLLQYNENRSFVLHDFLSEDPNFFAEVISIVYRPRDTKEGSESDEDDSSLSEQEKNRAGNGWQLLHSWKKIPGLKNDATIDENTLNCWIEKARELCMGTNRLEIGDQHIGMILANSPADKNNNWPPEPVCKVIETIKSKDINTGFSIQVYNNRGVVSKSRYEGGEQERKLSDKYRKMAENITTKFPQTALILFNIAEGYEEEAKLEDTKTHKRNLGY